MRSQGQRFVCLGASERVMPTGEAEGLFVEKKNVFKCGVLSLNRVAWKGGFWTGGTTSPVLSPCLPPGIRHRMTGPGGA